jgi:sarcosine oxidase subunit beta
MTDRNRAQVIIIGSGLNGAATAFFLAERGISDVLILDRGFPGAGASSRGMGLLRTFHANEPEAVLALKSITVFANWKERVGGSAGFRRTGFLWLDRTASRATLEGHIAMLRRLGSDSRLVEADELRRLQPHLHVEDTIAVWEPDCGTAYGYKANESLIAAALARGVRLRTRTAVQSLRAKAGRITGVKTDAGDLSAEAVVLAAGAWTAPLAATIGIDLPVESRRLTIGRVLMPPEIRNPATFLDGHFDTSFRPEDGNTALISMRDERYGAPMDPDARVDDVDNRAVAWGIERMKQRIPLAAQFIGLNTWTGVDGFTPDFKGIYGEHPRCRGLFVIAGASEKGLKVSPAVGMGTAELIATGRSPDLEKPEFSAARFDEAKAARREAQITVSHII